MKFDIVTIFPRMFDGPTREGILGRLLHESWLLKRQLSGSNGNEISIERGLLSSGAYLFRLEASGEAATGKLIVQ